MRIVISCSHGAAEEELRSLYAWLLAVPPARRHAGLALGASQPPELHHQGELVDILSLVLGSGFSAGSFSLALATWRATRPQEPVIRVERPDGVGITLTNVTPGEAERLVRLLGGESAPDSESEPSG
ncbi:effector-associated constant component EACC1 [Streptomyces albipurpureus]|uniref:Uncharacterized protein n=1 Tax=Streptomyces albipurpureus TaxID=2897419 RepID=A0ABT0UGJ3_9ACTN|nr:hypothetical protein [Streptomyces sp. CWNU-1]MCM2387555.1 hypothetical protein [Streptomyces sp. CWNU-1]